MMVLIVTAVKSGREEWSPFSLGVRNERIDAGQGNRT